MKRLLCCYVLLLGIICLLPARAEQLFSDISATDPDREAIIDTVTAQLMEGYPDGAFHPEAPVTRAEGVMLMTRVLNVALKGYMVLPGPRASHPDLEGIPPTHWVYPAAAFLADHGILDSFVSAPGTFQGERPLTRGEWMASLARMFHHGHRLSVTSAVTDFAGRALLPPGWKGHLTATISRREMARLLADVVFSLTQNAETEGCITALETDKAARQWVCLDTVLGQARLCLPTVGVTILGGSKVDLHPGTRIHTVSDAMNGLNNSGPYYRIRKVTVLAVRS